ncbi:hypothetical protein QJQ45_012030 [Haematococcus lacustris]|nr:hypothetical protein QJQ45_012030 [Haematococcus lacustris]
MGNFLTVEERNLDRNLAKRKRSRRPGQQPPQRRSANHPNFEEGQHDYEHPEPRPDADAREKTAGRIRKDRVEAEDAAWQERASADRHDIIDIWFEQSLLQSYSTSMGQGMSVRAAYPVAASLDAVVKFNHFQGVGHASSAVQPRLASHVSPAGLDGEVQRRHEANQLNLEFSMAGDVQGLSHTCKATLSCSNPTAVSTATAKRCDITGVVGCTCCHGVPARGTFCNMRTPEQFTYYLLLLEGLLESGPADLHIYVDFACRLKKTWMRYVAARGLPAAWADVKMWVPWMHAASHDQTCQLANNARYQMGAAFRVGEQAEQTWAMLKEMSKLVRYMTHAHRSDALQIRLAGIAFDKHANIVEHLAAKFKAMQMKKGKDSASYACPAMPLLNGTYACRDALPTLQPEMATLLANGRKLSQLRGIQDKVTTLGMAHGVHNLCGYWSSQEVEGSVHTVGLQLLKADMKASVVLADALSTVTAEEQRPRLVALVNPGQARWGSSHP